MSDDQLRINPSRLWRSLEEMAQKGAMPDGGICPAAMIFVPSRGGVSHSPAEYSSPKALEAGANVLLHTALRLAG